MSEEHAFDGVVLSALRILRDLDEGRADPAAAEKDLADVAAAHGLRCRLVEHEEAFDGSVHRDVIIRAPGRSTVSLSVASGPGLPWPLRGVPYTREYDLVEVNGELVPVAEALACLDGLFDDVRLMRGLVDSALVHQALDELGLDVTPERIQVASDAYRRARGLYSAEATAAWLRENGLTPRLLAERVERLAAVALLRRAVVGPQVERWVAEPTAEFDVLVVAWTSGSPSALHTDPLAAVRAAWRDGADAGVQQWRAADLPSGFAALRTAPVGEVVAVEHAGARASACVLERRAARLDPKTVALVERRLFDRWLAERRAAARVTWFWGDRRRTARTVDADG